jgi:hypothetical protein
VTSITVSSALQIKPSRFYYDRFPGDPLSIARHFLDTVNGPILRLIVAWPQR